jgi:hypothetical protein
MQRVLAILTCIILLVVFASCKKNENNNPDDCSSGATTRQIVNKPAVVKVTATVYGAYLVEQGTIDTKLIPCNLPMEFLQNDLQVTITGDVKSPYQNSGPCCAENFVILKISR